MLNVNKAFVLAAGLGTRLKPFSDRLPKPAWPLFDRPIASHLVDSLAEAGVNDFIVNLHHLPDAMRKALQVYMPGGAKVRWSFEERILGTGGALVPWLDELAGETFFLANGDTHRSFKPTDMKGFQTRAGADATLSLVRLETGQKGPIAVDEEGRIVRFLGAFSPGGREPAVECEFTGMHLIGPKVLPQLRRMAEKCEKFCINVDIHKAMVAEGACYYGYLPEDPRWSDLGTPESYLDGHFSFLTTGAAPDGTGGELVLLDRPHVSGGVIRAPSWIGEGAVIEAGATVGPFAVLCPGAHVEEGASVAHAVVWPGARAGGKVSGIAADWGEIMERDGRVRSSR